MDELHRSVWKGYVLGVLDECQFNSPLLIGVRYRLPLQEQTLYHRSQDSPLHRALKSTIRRPRSLAKQVAQTKFDYYKVSGLEEALYVLPASLTSVGPCTL